jgi:hypothetical protein
MGAEVCVRTEKEQWQGLRPVFFVPGTPHGKPGQVVRNWGTRPVRWFTEALVVDLRMNVEVRGIPSVPFEGR